MGVEICSGYDPLQQIKGTLPRGLAAISFFINYEDDAMFPARGLKRKLEEEEEDRRFSMYSLSLSKLNQCREEPNLARSVLICNTVRRLEFELGINGAPPLDYPTEDLSLLEPLPSSQQDDIFKDVDVSLYDYDILSPPSVKSPISEEDLGSFSPPASLTNRTGEEHGPTLLPS